MKVLKAASGTTDVPQFQQVPSIQATFYAQGTLSVRTGAGKFIVPTGNYTIGEVRAVVGTAATGTSVIADVNKNGTTIYSGGTGRPTIAVSTTTAVTDGTPSTTTVAAGDLLSVDIDQIGSTIAGADLTVVVELVRTS